MGVRIVHNLRDLQDDLETIAREFKPRAAREVRGVARDGNRVAKRFARRSAGAHGTHYHRAFSTEAHNPLRWEWGPDSTRPQGGMSFERGSRNQPPHHDIAKAADIHGAADLQRRVGGVLDGLFWP